LALWVITKESEHGRCEEENREEARQVDQEESCEEVIRISRFESACDSQRKTGWAPAQPVFFLGGESRPGVADAGLWR
jgi:hypothetical protein